MGRCGGCRRQSGCRHDQHQLLHAQQHLRRHRRQRGRLRQRGPHPGRTARRRTRTAWPRRRSARPTIDEIQGAATPVAAGRASRWPACPAMVTVLGPQGVLDAGGHPRRRPRHQRGHLRLHPHGTDGRGRRQRHRGREVSRVLSRRRQRQRQHHDDRAGQPDGDRPSRPAPRLPAPVVLGGGRVAPAADASRRATRGNVEDDQAFYSPGQRRARLLRVARGHARRRDATPRSSARPTSLRRDHRRARRSAVRRPAAPAASSTAATTSPTPAGAGRRRPC